MLRDKKGFTLVELLVVVAIIGLLSTLAVVALGSARGKARDAKRLSDIKQVQTALELFYNDNNGYPVAAAPPLALGGAGAVTLSGAGITAANGAAGTTYMGQVPSNPAPGGAPYNYTPKKSDNGDCTAAPVTNCVSYNITFTLEGQTGSLAAGAHTATPSGIQ